MNKINITYKVVKKSIENMSRGVKYHLAKILNKPQYFTFLVFAVTQKCNSRCLMCSIWKKENTKELSVEEIKEIIENEIFSKLKYVNLTGGEPFLRKDLANIAHIFGNLKELKAIQIPTNGLLSGRIVESVKNILEGLPKHVFLGISVSIDGDEKIHNYIRGINGIYKKAVETLNQLQSLKDPRLNIGIETTVTKDNIDSIDYIYKHLKKLSEHVVFYPVISSSGYYANSESEAVKKDKNYIKKAIKFFSFLENVEPEYAFLYNKMRLFLEKQKRTFGCLAGRKTVFLNAKGDLFPCFMFLDNKEYLLGNLLNKNIIEYLNEKGNIIRNKIGRNNPICSKCSLCCDLINIFNEEFFEVAFFYVMNPLILVKLLRDIRSDKIKRKNIN